jgi:hypothetical protein
VLTRDGIPVEQVPVGRYTAPPPPSPGRVSGVRMLRKGKGVLVRWRSARNADAYVVVVRSGDGLSRRITTGPKRRAARVTGIDRDDSAAVTVRAVTEIGRQGPPSADRLRAPRTRR